MIVEQFNAAAAEMFGVMMGNAIAVTKACEAAMMMPSLVRKNPKTDDGGPAKILPFVAKRRRKVARS
jgi:hypothetical protein